MFGQFQYVRPEPWDPWLGNDSQRSNASRGMCENKTSKQKKTWIQSASLGRDGNYSRRSARNIPTNADEQSMQ
jgi:hypothetical protein